MNENPLYYDFYKKSFECTYYTTYTCVKHPDYQFRKYNDNYVIDLKPEHNRLGGMVSKASYRNIEQQKARKLHERRFHN